MPDRTSLPDHRVEVAARKRAEMRARLLDATLRAFGQAPGRTPVIDDVVKAAGVSRGAFYRHFRSVEEAQQALSQAQSDQMTREALAVYDLLKEPWRRFAVGFRLFLKRAGMDPVWASFVAQAAATADQLLVTELLRQDLRRGRELGQFAIADLDAAVDFLMNASVGGIRALGRGVAEPERYIDECVRMALAALGCSPAMQAQGVAFSRSYLDGWRMRQAGEDALPFVPFEDGGRG